ncbi:MAG TPA: diguanylate cyclase [Actinoplanes sp.]|jgi:diguanylate cyclase (GGDEF)-like protein
MVPNWAGMQQQEITRGAALTGLLRGSGGTTGQRIDRALTVLVDQLDMQVAFVSEFRDGHRVVTHSMSAPGGPVLPVGLAHPVEETVCHLIVSGAVATLTPDAAADPVLAGHPHTAAFGIGAYAGAPLAVAGRVRGAVCCASTAPAGTLNPRDESTLRAVTTYIGDLLTTDPEPGPDPDPGAAVSSGVAAVADLSRLAAAVAGSQDLQTLARPLLQLLQEFTGLESTFLTLIDPAADEQVLAYTHNTGRLDLPEGAAFGWQDTLCRRNLDNDRAYVADVPSPWPDATVAIGMGITSYVGVPIRDAHDDVLGTLCGVSTTTTPITEQHLTVMSTFAQLLSAQLARETALSIEAARATALEQRLGVLREAADRDTLTGLSNRAGIHRWLQTALDRLTGDEHLAVAFIDLDRFKNINDTRGHATGDDVLRRVATSLAHTGRAGDLHGRLGGDEFIIAAVLPLAASVDDWHSRIRRAATIDVDDLHVIGSVGVITHHRSDPALTVDEMLHHADLAMYREKNAART